MPAAVAIPALIGAGTSIAGGAMQSRAANNAAKTQAASADRAMALQREMLGNALGAQYQNQQAINQLYSPYTQTAPMSLAALNSFVMGGESGYPQQVPGGPPGQGYFPGAPVYKPYQAGPMPPMMQAQGQLGGPPPPAQGMPPGGAPVARRTPLPMSAMYQR